VIQITPYNKRSNRADILKAYLFLLDKALPFFKKDLYVLAAEKFELDKNIVQGIFPDQLVTDTERQGAVNAEQDIQSYSRGLHTFLYQHTAGDGHINIDRLYELLTVPMIEEVWALKGMTFAVDPPREKKPSRLESVFNYKAVSRDKQRMYAFTKELKTEVCPYCNRIFTATVMQQTCSADGIRPQLDHFKNKKRYPFFAMSIMNWVPSCGFCNQRKSTQDRKILYPYAEGVGENYLFRTCFSQAETSGGHAIYVTGAQEAENNFVIRGEIVPDIPDEAAYAVRLRYIQEAGQPDIFSASKRAAHKEAYIQRLKESEALFCWVAACQHHKSYVLRMFRQNYQFGKEYGASLGRSFSSLFFDPSLTYLRDIRKEYWGDAPLAKLTHDIDLEIQDYNRTVHY